MMDEGTKRWARAFASLAALAVLAGCQSGSSGAAAGNAAALSGAAGVTVTPSDGATAVPPDTKVLVTANSGQLASVIVANAAGKQVEGEFDANHTTWRATSELSGDTAYMMTVRTTGPAGEATRTTSFHTAEPEKVLTASVLPLNGETVGVGLPIVVYLSAPVADRAAVERRLRVESSRPVEGAWHWMSDDEIHFRPHAFWPAHTKVTLHADLAGVDAGGGVRGSKDRLIQFETGEAIVSRVNVKSLTMTVTRDGKPMRTIPVTAGKEGFTTRSGIKVISEKHRVKVMDAATIGINPKDPEYYQLRVEYALRVTNSGEFLHAAPWSVGSQGETRVSHGCVGMSTADARWLYGITHRGDVVKVSGTNRKLEPGNGFTDWNMSWQEWLAGSALS
jgi:lipoprotein-anchoring transpeptidase ErfK/SrfK